MSSVGVHRMAPADACSTAFTCVYRPKNVHALRSLTHCSWAYRGIHVIHKITSFTLKHKLLPKHWVSATLLILHALMATCVWSIWFVCVLYIYWYHIYMHLLLNLVTTHNIVYLSDKAMLTVCHSFLCALSHLYYVCHCIVLCTVCPFLFTVNPQVTLHRSRPVEYRLCFPSFEKRILVFTCRFNTSL